MVKKFNDPITGRKGITSETIMKKLLEAADRIIEYRIAIALGFQDKILENFELGNSDYQDMIIEQVEPVLSSFKETKRIEAKNSGAVIAMLQSGKVSPQEAISLLKVVKEKLDVEEKEKMAELKAELLDELEESDEFEGDIEEETT